MDPSPNVQFQLVGEDVVRSVKFTDEFIHELPHVKSATGGVKIIMGLVIVSRHPNVFSIIKVTLYVPGPGNKWNGFCKEEVSPSPNVQYQ